MTISSEDLTTCTRIDIALDEAIEEAKDVGKQYKHLYVTTSFPSINKNVERLTTSFWRGFGWELKLYHNTWRMRPIS